MNSKKVTHHNINGSLLTQEEIKAVIDGLGITDMNLTGNVASGVLLALQCRQPNPAILAELTGLLGTLVPSCEVEIPMGTAD